MLDLTPGPIYTESMGARPRPIHLRRAAAGVARGSTLAVLALALVTAGLAQDSREPWRDWTTLRMRARGVPMFSGQFEMRREGKGRLATSATARFLGATVARSRTETVFDAQRGTARHLRHSKKHARRYVFEDTGYVAEKLVPPQGGAGSSIDTWRVVGSQRFDYPSGGARIFDHYGMLMRLGQERLTAVGDQVTILVATSQVPEPFTVRVADARRMERRLRHPQSGATQVAAIDELRLHVSPADPAKAGEGFLDMEGDTEIWVEAESKTPTEIEGKVPGVGRVRLELVELG
jgi:hypothetical protein